MAFNPGGTDYGGFLEQRRLSDVGLTKALKAKGEAEKAKRIADSKKRSGGQKLLSAVARGAAAYYTGGMSESMGYGDKIDKAMLGQDAETNEYGELVGAASQVGGAMSTKKGMEMTEKLAAQDKADAAMQTRMDNLDPSGQMGMEFAMNREKKQRENLEAMEPAKEGSFGGLFQGDIEGVNLEPTTVGDWESKIPPKPTNAVTHTGGPPSLQTPSESAIKPSAVEGPAWSPSAGSSKAPTSAAQKFESSVSSPTLQTQAATEKDRLIEDTGKSGNEEQERKNKRHIDNWMRTPLTIQPQQFGDDKFTRALDPTTGTKWGDDYLNRNAIKSGRGAQ